MKFCKKRSDSTQSRDRERGREEGKRERKREKEKTTKERKGETWRCCTRGRYIKAISGPGVCGALVAFPTPLIMFRKVEEEEEENEKGARHGNEATRHGSLAISTGRR